MSHVTVTGLQLHFAYVQYTLVQTILFDRFFSTKSYRYTFLCHFDNKMIVSVTVIIIISSLCGINMCKFSLMCLKFTLRLK